MVSPSNYFTTYSPSPGAAGNYFCHPIQALCGEVVCQREREKKEMKIEEKKKSTMWWELDWESWFERQWACKYYNANIINIITLMHML